MSMPKCNLTFSFLEAQVQLSATELHTNDPPPHQKKESNSSPRFFWGVLNVRRKPPPPKKTRQQFKSNSPPKKKKRPKETTPDASGLEPLDGAVRTLLQLMPGLGVSAARSSSKEVRISWHPLLFSVVYVSRGFPSQPKKRGVKGQLAGGPRWGCSLRPSSWSSKGTPQNVCCPLPTCPHRGPENQGDQRLGPRLKNGLTRNKNKRTEQWAVDAPARLHLRVAPVGNPSMGSF